MAYNSVFDPVFSSTQPSLDERVANSKINRSPEIGQITEDNFPEAAKNPEVLGRLREQLSKQHPLLNPNGDPFTGSDEEVVSATLDRQRWQRNNMSVLGAEALAGTFRSDRENAGEGLAKQFYDASPDTLVGFAKGLGQAIADPVNLLPFGAATKLARAISLGDKALSPIISNIVKHLPEGISAESAAGREFIASALRKQAISEATWGNAKVGAGYGAAYSFLDQTDNINTDLIDGYSVAGVLGGAALGGAMGAGLGQITSRLAAPFQKSGLMSKIDDALPAIKLQEEAEAQARMKESLLASAEEKTAAAQEKRAAGIREVAPEERAAIEGTRDVLRGLAAKADSEDGILEALGSIGGKGRVTTLVAKVDNLLEQAPMEEARINDQIKKLTEDFTAARDAGGEPTEIIGTVETLKAKREALTALHTFVTSDAPSILADGESSSAVTVATKIDELVKNIDNPQPVVQTKGGKGKPAEKPAAQPAETETQTTPGAIETPPGTQEVAPAQAPAIEGAATTAGGVAQATTPTPTPAITADPNAYTHFRGNPDYEAHQEGFKIAKRQLKGNPTTIDNSVAEALWNAGVNTNVGVDSIPALAKKLVDDKEFRTQILGDIKKLEKNVKDAQKNASKPAAAPVATAPTKPQKTPKPSEWTSSVDELLTYGGGKKGISQETREELRTANPKKRYGLAHTLARAAIERAKFEIGADANLDEIIAHAGFSSSRKYIIDAYVDTNYRIIEDAVANGDVSLYEFSVAHNEDLIKSFMQDARGIRKETRESFSSLSADSKITIPEDNLYQLAISERVKARRISTEEALKQIKDERAAALKDIANRSDVFKTTLILKGASEKVATIKQRRFVQDRTREWDDLNGITQSKKSNYAGESEDSARISNYQNMENRAVNEPVPIAKIKAVLAKEGNTRPDLFDLDEATNRILEEIGRLSNEFGILKSNAHFAKEETISARTKKEMAAKADDKALAAKWRSDNVPNPTEGAPAIHSKDMLASHSERTLEEIRYDNLTKLYEEVLRGTKTQEDVDAFVARQKKVVERQRSRGNAVEDITDEEIAFCRKMAETQLGIKSVQTAAKNSVAEAAQAYKRGEITLNDYLEILSSSVEKRRAAVKVAEDVATNPSIEKVITTKINGELFEVDPKKIVISNKEGVIDVTANGVSLGTIERRSASGGLFIWRDPSKPNISFTNEDLLRKVIVSKMDNASKAQSSVKALDQSLPEGIEIPKEISATKEAELAKAILSAPKVTQEIASITREESGVAGNELLVVRTKHDNGWEYRVVKPNQTVAQVVGNRGASLEWEIGKVVDSGNAAKIANRIGAYDKHFIPLGKDKTPVGDLSLIQVGEVAAKAQLKPVALFELKNIGLNHPEFKTAADLQNHIQKLELTQWKDIDHIDKLRAHISELKAGYDMMAQVAPHGVKLPVDKKWTAVNKLSDLISGKDEDTTLALDVFRRLAGDNAPIIEGRSLGNQSVGRTVFPSGKSESLDNKILIDNIDGDTRWPKHETIGHEVFHWAYNNILTNEERLKFWSEMEKFYGDDGNLIMADIEAVLPRVGLDTNQLESPAEFFANNGMQYFYKHVLGDQSIGLVKPAYDKAAEEAGKASWAKTLKNSPDIIAAAIDSGLGIADVIRGMSQKFMAVVERMFGIETTSKGRKKFIDADGVEDDSSWPVSEEMKDLFGRIFPQELDESRFVVKITDASGKPIPHEDAFISKNAGRILRIEELDDSRIAIEQHMNSYSEAVVGDLGIEDSFVGSIYSASERIRNMIQNNKYVILDASKGSEERMNMFYNMFGSRFKKGVISGDLKEIDKAIEESFGKGIASARNRELDAADYDRILEEDGLGELDGYANMDGSASGGSSSSLANVAGVADTATYMKLHSLGLKTVEAIHLIQNAIAGDIRKTLPSGYKIETDASVRAGGKTTSLLKDFMFRESARGKMFRGAGKDSFLARWKSIKEQAKGDTDAILTEQGIKDDVRMSALGYRALKLENYPRPEGQMPNEILNASWSDLKKYMTMAYRKEVDPKLMDWSLYRLSYEGMSTKDLGKPISADSKIVLDSARAEIEALVKDQRVGDVPDNIPAAIDNLVSMAFHRNPALNSTSKMLMYRILNLLGDDYANRLLTSGNGIEHESGLYVRSKDLKEIISKVRSAAKDVVGMRSDVTVHALANDVLARMALDDNAVKTLYTNIAVSRGIDHKNFSHGLFRLVKNILETEDMGLPLLRAALDGDNMTMNAMDDVIHNGFFGDNVEMRDLLTSIKDNNVSEYYKRIADYLSKNESAKVSTDVGIGGHPYSYIRENHSINFDMTDGTMVGRSSADMVKTAIHESAHAATVRRIMGEFYNFGEVVKSGDPMYAFAIANGKDGMLQAKVILSNTQHFSPEVVDLAKLYQHSFKHLDGYYGQQDLHEFVAEGLSNVRFQDALNKIHYEGQSVWSKLVKTFAKILGIKPSSALGELFSVSTKIIDQDRLAFEAYETLANPDALSNDLRRALKEVSKSKGDVISYLTSGLLTEDSKALIPYEATDVFGIMADGMDQYGRVVNTTLARTPISRLAKDIAKTPLSPTSELVGAIVTAPRGADSSIVIPGLAELLDKSNFPNAVKAPLMKMAKQKPISERDMGNLREISRTTLLSEKAVAARSIGADWLANWFKPEDGVGYYERHGSLLAGALTPLFDKLDALSTAWDSKRTLLHKLNPFGDIPQTGTERDILRAVRRGDVTRLDKAEDRAAANDVIKWFRDMRSMMLAAGVRIGDITSAEGISGYIPQLWRKERIEAKTEEAIQTIAQFFYRDSRRLSEAQKMMGESITPISEEEAMKKAKMFVDVMLADDMGNGIILPSGAGGYKDAIGDQFFRRVMTLRSEDLSELKANGIDLEYFLEDNLRALMSKYADSSIRRALSTEQFGHNMHGLDTYLDIAHRGKEAVIDALSSSKEMTMVIGAGAETANKKLTYIYPIGGDLNAIADGVKALVDIGDMDGALAFLNSKQQFKTDDWGKRAIAIVNGLSDFGAGKHSVHGDSVRQLKQMTDSILGKSISPGSMNDIGRRVRTFNSVTMLPFAVLTSLPDVVMPMIRSGNFKAWFNGWSKYMSDPAYRSASKNIGVGIENILHENLSQLHGGMSGNVTRAFFYGNLLHPWTKMQREVAAVVGFESIRSEQEIAHRMIQSGDTGARYQEAVRYLRRLGLAEYAKPDAPKFGEITEAQNNEKIRTALHRFVNEAIFSPNRNDIPLWGDTPWGKLVMQFKTYPLMMQRLAKYTFDEARQNNYKPLLYLISMVPAAGMGASAVKDVVQGRNESTEAGVSKADFHSIRAHSGLAIAQKLGADVETEEDANTFLGWYIEGVLQAGALGMMSDLLYQSAAAVDNGAWGQQRIMSLIAGPSVGDFASAVNVLGGAKAGAINMAGYGDDTNFRQRQAWREAISRLPFVGGIRSIREASVDALAGERGGNE